MSRMAGQYPDARVQSHVQHALHLIQEAQGRLELAAQALSPIVGMAADCQRVADAREKIRALWYRLEGRRSRLRPNVSLDDTHLASRYPCTPCRMIDDAPASTHEQER